MGFLDKIQTGRRVQPSVVPYPEAPTRVGADLQIDRVMRAAAAHLGGGSYRSSTFRGRQTTFMGLGGGGTVVNSTVWFEKTGIAQWQLALGADSSRERLIDWAIRAQGTRPADQAPTVSVSTPNFLSSNGALEKAKLHDEVRQLVQDGIAGQTVVPEDGLEACFATALERAGEVFVEQTEPAQATAGFEIRTALPETEARRRLRLAMGVAVEEVPGGYRYQLAPDAGASATATVTQHPKRPESWIGQVAFLPSGDALLDRISWAAAQHFPESLMGYFRLFAGEAEMVTEPAWR